MKKDCRYQIGMDVCMTPSRLDAVRRTPVAENLGHKHKVSLVGKIPLRS